jgi:hypothetical protein
LGYRFLIIFVLSIISWAVVLAILGALPEAMCALLRVIAQKNELCDAPTGCSGFFDFVAFRAWKSPAIDNGADAVRADADFVAAISPSRKGDKPLARNRSLDL